MLNLNIRELYIFNLMVGNAADDTALTRVCILDCDITDRHISKLAHGGPASSMHASPQTKEKRDVLNVPHFKITDLDILQYPTIDSFEGEAAAAIEGAVRDCDVPKTAITLGTTLNATDARS